MSADKLFTPEHAPIPGQLGLEREDEQAGQAWKVEHARLADELDAAGWPSVADDVRDGVPVDTVLNRLHAIGEGDSDAAEIIAWPTR